MVIHKSKLTGASMPTLDYRGHQIHYHLRQTENSWEGVYQIAFNGNVLIDKTFPVAATNVQEAEEEVLVVARAELLLGLMKPVQRAPRQETRDR